ATNKHYNHHRHCQKVVKAHHYTRTVYPSHCPKVQTKTTTTTSTATSTATATTTSTSTSTFTSVLVIPTCRASGTFCDLSNFVTCCTQCCLLTGPNQVPINQCC
ncbi:2543_t:CDS:1, partial [Rhizophagus irregularis]